MGGIGKLLLVFVFSSAIFVVFADDSSFVVKTDLLGNLGLQKTEKLSHFRVYWHDITGGKNPSSVQIIAPIISNTTTTTTTTNTITSTSFGLVRMFDNPLTAGVDPRSKLWGKAEGLYAAASQEKLSVLMAMNFAFESGKYNGSSISIFGRNKIGEKVREMPVIGGSGAFRFARGFAKATTVKFDQNVAVVQYDLYILHY